MPLYASRMVFYSHFQFKFFIVKSGFTIISKLDISVSKSTDDLTLLTVRSPINTGHFNKRRHPTSLTTCIYYLIWPPHIPATVTNGRLVTTNNLNLVQPIPRGSPCYAKLKSAFFFWKTLSGVHCRPRSIGLQATPINEVRHIAPSNCCNWTAPPNVMD